MTAARLLVLLALTALAPPAAASTWDHDYEKGVIAEDTTWSGRVRVTGQLRVRKGVTLTILPGTQVVFAWSDADGNGIGDGELKIEGRLVARGRADDMIVFTSGRTEPSVKDWTYIMIELSRDNLVEHCLFEHAFTGLQIHFASGTVRENLFRRNFEAMRFSTADLLIERNEITGNRYGIRYESRGSKAVITRNDVRGNYYGFFPVIKSTSTVTIEDNNIENTEYNVKIGQRQSVDLDFARNWWGTADPAAIERGFFDGRSDPALGRVLYEPFLKSPVAGAGRGEAEGTKR